MRMYALAIVAAAALFPPFRHPLRRHCHIEQVVAVIDRGEARLRHWNRVAGLSPGSQ